MKFLISLAFKLLTQAEFKMFARIVELKMTNNPYFVHLLVEIAALKAGNDALTIAIADADGGSTEQTIIKNNCMDAVSDLLDDLAKKVNARANGDELIVLSSGFKLVKARNAVAEFPTPTFVELLNTTTTSEAKSKWQCEKSGVTSFTVEYQIKGEEMWRAAGTPSARELYISRIPSGSVITVRVCSNGTRNRQSEWVYSLPLMIS